MTPSIETTNEPTTGTPDEIIARPRVSSIPQLQAEDDASLITCNTRRHNHGDFMRGTIPREVLDAHLSKKAS